MEKSNQNKPLLRAGVLIKIGLVSTKMFGVRIFNVISTDEEWPGDDCGNYTGHKLSVNQQDYFVGIKNNILGMIISGPHYKNTEYWPKHFDTYFKVLINKNLYWIDCRHLHFI